MRTRWWIGAGLAALALAGAAGLLAYRLRRDPDALPPAFAGRALIAATHLAQVTAPYAVLIGDSHAERMLLPTLCGAPVVNAGIAGATARIVGAAAAQLAFPEPARTIVVIAGTNDLQRARGGGTPEGLVAFRTAYEALLARLRPHAMRLLAVPIPPIDGTRADIARAFAAEAVPRYDAVIAEACARAGCTLAPLFDGNAADLAASDGVHPPVAALTRPGGARERLERAACGSP